MWGFPLTKDRIMSKLHYLDVEIQPCPLYREQPDDARRNMSHLYLQCNLSESRP